MSDHITLADLSRKIEELGALIRSSIDDAPAIHPRRLYNVKEVADFLGFADKDSVYNIPESELPRHKVGPNRGAVRFAGINILRYAENLPPVPFSALMQVEVPVTSEKTRLI